MAISHNCEKNGLSDKKISVFDKKMKIYDAASEINVMENDAWKDVEDRYGDVVALTVSANSDSIIIMDNDFEGIFIVNISITYFDDEDNKDYKCGDYLTGNFFGEFDEKGEPKFNIVNLFVPKNE